MVLDLQEFDLHDLTDEVFADLEMRAKERNVRLTYKEGANQHYRYGPTRKSIRQVLMNLIHNSIKYGRQDGLTKVSFYDMENYIPLEISYHAKVGINPEHLAHVFDRFYRCVDKSRSRDAGAICVPALDWAIVKHIIEAHKQTVNVRSNVGQGSALGLTLEKA